MESTCESRTIHLIINPRRGGRPPIESKDLIRASFAEKGIGFHIWLIEDNSNK